MLRSSSLSVYIIGSLQTARAKELKKKLELTFPGCPITVNAIFPGDTDFNRFKSSFRTKVRLARRAVPGEFGCSLSHKWAYEHFLSSSSMRAVIFEDDAILGPGFSLDKVLEVSSDKVITLLGYHEPSPWTGPAITRFPSTGTFAYTLDRKAAEKILRLHKKERFGVSVPADWPVSLTLCFSHAAPALVYHPDRGDSQSLIGDRDTSSYARGVSLLLTAMFPLDAALRLRRFLRLLKAPRSVEKT